MPNLFPVNSTKEGVTLKKLAITPENENLFTKFLNTKKDFKYKYPKIKGDKESRPQNLLKSS